MTWASWLCTGLEFCHHDDGAPHSMGIRNDGSDETAKMFLVPKRDTESGVASEPAEPAVQQHMMKKLAKRSPTDSAAKKCDTKCSNAMPKLVRDVFSGKRKSCSTWP